MKEDGSIQKDPSSSSLSAMDKNKSNISSGSYQASSLLSSSVDWTKRRRKSNTKYLSAFEDDDDDDDDDDDESQNRSRYNHNVNGKLFIIIIATAYTIMSFFCWLINLYGIYIICRFIIKFYFSVCDIRTDCY